MTGTVTKLRPVRTLLLPCGHPQETPAVADSSIDCKTCDRHVKVTARMIAAADQAASAKNRSQRTRAVASTVTAPAARGWSPLPIAPHVPERDPGACPDCGTQRTWSPRASMAWCPHCRTLALPSEVVRAHTRAAGPQQHKTDRQRDADNADLYRQAERITDAVDELLSATAGLDADTRGGLRYLRDEAIRARRERNEARLAGINAEVAELLDELAGTEEAGAEETGYDPTDAGDDLDVVDDPAAGRDSGSGVHHRAWPPWPVTAQLPSAPVRKHRRRRAVSKPAQSALPEWLLPAPAAQPHPLIVRDTGSGGQREAWLAARRQAVQADGARRVQQLGGQVVLQSFHDLAERDAEQRPRTLLARAFGALLAGQRGLPAGRSAGAQFWTDLDNAQRAAWQHAAAARR